MKICLLNNLYQPFNRGGAEKICQTIIQGLVASGHQVCLITTKPYAKPVPVVDGRFKIYHLNSLYYNLNKWPKALRLLWHWWDMVDPLNYFRVKKILAREKCQAVITNNLMGLGYLSGRAAKKLKIRHVHIVHDIQFIHPSGIMYYGQEKKVYNLLAGNYAGLCSRLLGSPDVVIFPSRWLMNMHLEKIFFIKSKRIILPNPVDISDGARPPANRPNFKFLYLGQLENHKGVFLLLEAFAKIKIKFPQAELLIAGGGSQFQAVKSQAEQSEGIKIFGQVESREAENLLKRADCLVMPTLCYENCPAVIQEAFAAGLPVLAADLGGIRELLSKNAGLLFKPADFEDLINKMSWAIENYSQLQTMAKAGREKVAFCLTDNYIRELEKILVN